MPEQEAAKKNPIQSSAVKSALWFAATAGIAAVLDWYTKLVAVRELTSRPMLFGSKFALMVVYNPGGAGGMSWGEHTVLINIVLTSISVIMIGGVVMQLARVDGRAALALGLVAGGAIGNLFSMLTGSSGVVDFLAIRSGDRAIVCNVADLALWSGALLLVPVVRSLVRAIRAERAERAMRVNRAGFPHPDLAV